MTKNHTLDLGLVGVWISCDPFDSSVEHRVSASDGKYAVELVDANDGEAAEVFGVAWDGERLSYSAHWQSTGRHVKNVLMRVDDGRVSLTYTHTSTDTLIRKKERNA